MAEKMWFKFYECDCHTEGIAFSNDFDDDKEFPIRYLSFFKMGSEKRFPLSIFERLRWCWRIIVKGYPFLDDIVLSKNIAKELGTDLIEWSIKK